MSDLMVFLKGPWGHGLLVYVAGYILINCIQYFLRRKFPQIGKWKALAISTGIFLVLAAVYIATLYFTSPLSDHRDYPIAQVEWRTEIRQADEPDTWPFKEPRYMLSCLGGNGDYSVYLVRVEDISFAPDRASDFQPQYYGLKGSWKGWKKGETQLLDGQTPEAFKKYVDRSLRLCKEAESRKDGG